MTIQMFITILTTEAVLNGLLTEAVKKAIPKMSSNILALVDAIIIGIAGTAVYFNCMSISIKENWMYLIPMTVAVWVGSMVGYDKVIQTIKQVVV